MTIGGKLRGAKRLNVRAALWSCPRCARRFRNRGQQHACGSWTVADHFRGRPVRLRRLFAALVRLIRTNGPFRFHAAKTRIGLISRMTFCAVTPLHDRLRAHFILSRRPDSPLFDRIERVGNRYVCQVTLRSAADLDAELRAFAAESYRVGALS